MSNTKSIGKFSDSNELIEFARRFVSARIKSLENDILGCLNEPFIPFPTILYCFSTIDLLGALYTGQATSHSPESNTMTDIKQNSKNYMEKFMNYNAEKRGLLMDVFRYKIIHLAQSTPIMKTAIESDNSGASDSTTVSSGTTIRTVALRLYRNNREKHLVLEDASMGSKCIIKSHWEIKFDSIFNISMSQLVEDIRISTEKPNGYLNRLELEADLQCKFAIAIENIFIP